MAVSLLYDGQVLSWKDGTAVVKTFTASSGIHEPVDRVFRVGNVAYRFREDYRWSWYEKTKDKGPIPSGTFILESAILKNPWAQFDGPTCTLKVEWGIERIPRGGDPTKEPHGTEAGKCDPYWANWGYNRVRLTPLGDMVGPHRGGFYIHDSVKGFSHGCVETEQIFFSDHLLPWAQKNKDKRMRLSVQYKHERTYGGTLAGGGPYSIKGVPEGLQINSIKAFREFCLRLKAGKPSAEEAADAKANPKLPKVTLDPPPQDRLPQYDPAMALGYGPNDISRNPKAQAMIPGWWGAIK